MKVKIADYIAGFLVEHGIKYNFTVPGGGAMHLNDAFAQNEDLNCIYVQHEQAGAIAAEVYARMNNTLPLVCCTTGPGGTNTLTGVLGAWLDSIPMLVISGQVKYEHTIHSTGLPLRALGDQEFPIIPVVKPMTKYAEMVCDFKMVKYHLQRALYVAQNGRPGPVWLDIPLNIQGGYFDTDDFVEFDPMELQEEHVPTTAPELLDEIIERIKKAKRPVLYTGNGIRIANAYDELQETISKLKIPVIESFDGIDVTTDDNPYYIGRGGLIGDRAGNFAVQNSDLVLSVGSRLGVRQVGYDVKTWAREAFVIMVDIDKAELEKPIIHVDIPIQADAKEFLLSLNERIGDIQLDEKKDWVSTCRTWREKYPVVTEQHKNAEGLVNGYYYMDELTKRLPENQVTITGNGSSCVISSQVFKIKKGQRYAMNSGAASMGYDVPGAIGACFATNKSPIICLSGDGSIQMNLQELQTIVFHKLPIKIFVINNNGYHSMRQTIGNLFSEHKPFGIGPESNDLSFPSLEKIAYAYGIPYFSMNDNKQVTNVLDKALQQVGFAIVEIFTTTDQKFEPKSATKKLEDGTLVSPPLEDLAPFLPREELEEIMIIPML